MGLELGIQYHTLKKIEEDQRGCGVEACKREMLAAWLQGDDNVKEQTWFTLVDALRSMDQNALADKIENM